MPAVTPPGRSPAAPAKASGRASYFFRFLPAIFNFAVWVLAMPPWGLKVIRALTLSLPRRRSFALASLVRRSGTMIVWGPPEALEGFSRSFRFFLDATALRGAFASLSETPPEAWTLTINFLPLTKKLKVLVAAKISALEKYVLVPGCEPPATSTRPSPSGAATGVERAVPIEPMPAELKVLVAGSKTSALAVAWTLEL